VGWRSPFQRKAESSPLTSDTRAIFGTDTLDPDALLEQGRLLLAKKKGADAEAVARRIIIH
jgi:hypothetical protein